jgi:hypothetical protein
MSTPSLYTRVQTANEDTTRLKEIINDIPKDITMLKFSEHMWSVCPYMCDDCDFCCMVFKYNAGKEHFKNIIKKLVFSFYYGLDISTLTFLTYYICPMCAVKCKDIYNGNDCPYDYLKQFDGYKPMFPKPVFSGDTPLKKSYPDLTTIKFDHKKGILVTRKPGGSTYKPLRPKTTTVTKKPHILIQGQTMTKIINNLWGMNENTSQTWDNST